MNVQQFLSGKDLLILDCGCGQKPYFPFFKNISYLYIGIDLKRSKHVDVVGDVQKLPFKDCSFDAILCTQVMQYITSPKMLLEEIYRILKDGGFLFLSTHGVWPVEDNFMLWRWTDSGLQKMLDRFSEVKIYECGGNIASLLQIINLCVPVIRYVSAVIWFVLNKTGEFLDDRFRRKEWFPGLIMCYLAVAKK
jgi:SAM-dependent methyltransferase